jgi:hypothetical protein
MFLPEDGEVFERTLCLVWKEGRGDVGPLGGVLPRSFRRHTDYETMRLHRGCSPNGATDKFRLLPRATPGATDRELLPRELLPVQQAGSYSRELLPVQQAGSYSRLLPRATRCNKPLAGTLTL